MFALALGVVCALPTRAQTYTVLHNFTNGADGGTPTAGMIFDRAGNLYGTTQFGGEAYGNVFKFSRNDGSWLLNPLYGFTDESDGAYPSYGGLTFGPDGLLYGASSFGGDNQRGTVFTLQPQVRACRTALCPWSIKVIHTFGNGNDGGNPDGKVVFDAASTLYGTTSAGGLYQYGSVFKMSRSGGAWTYNVIFNFNASTGETPMSGVVIDSAGNLYGTTSSGGDDGQGVVYELSPSGSGYVEKVLYSFTNGNDGGLPFGGLVFDQAGNLYGSTEIGGAGGGGTLFELSQSGGNWTLTTFYSLEGRGGPYDTLTMDAAGSLYGSTYRDGSYQQGNVFKMSRSGGGWTYSSLYDFSGGSDGMEPTGSVVLDTAGSVYGTTSGGGTQRYGVIFMIVP